MPGAILASQLDSPCYDVAIMGAGPAGAQLARELSQRGLKVFLSEKAKSFTTNNFSSGGAPLALMEEFQLPSSIVGSYWNKFALSGPHGSQLWDSEEPQGVICDFAQLRAFLAQDAASHGATIAMDTSYVSHHEAHDHVVIELKSNASRTKQWIKTRLLVDATGTDRKAIGIPPNTKSVEMTGIEYLIEVPLDIYQRFSQKLSFYIGPTWMPQGYAWVFPMESGILKVGVVRYFTKEQVVPHSPSYTTYLNHLLEHALDGATYTLLDRHGKTIHYTMGQKDYYQKNRILAVGDSVSMLNPLACEGIRHAMVSARLAVNPILDFLNGNERALSTYFYSLKQYRGWGWTLSEFVMDQIYRQPSTKRIDIMIDAFRKLNFQELLNMGFGYNLKPILKFSYHYWSKCLRSKC